jgi:hypothetical protein
MALIFFYGIISENQLISVLSVQKQTGLSSYIFPSSGV